MNLPMTTRLFLFISLLGLVGCVSDDPFPPTMGPVFEHKNSQSGILFTEGGVPPISEEEALRLARKYHREHHPIPGYLIGDQGVIPVGDYYHVSIPPQKFVCDWTGYMVHCRTGEVTRIPDGTLQEKRAWVLELIE